MDFLKIRKNLKKDYSGFPAYHLALVSNSTPQFLAQALKGVAFDHGINLQLYEANLGQISQEVLEESSGLYRFAPHTVLLYFALPTLQSEFYSLAIEERGHFGTHFIQRLSSWIEILEKRGIKKIFVNVLPELLDPVFGQGGISLLPAFAHQIKRINHALTELSLTSPLLSLIDVRSIVSEIGYQHFFDPNLYYSSQSDLSFQALPLVAEQVLKLIDNQLGKTKKCLVLDLDNTLWGGVVGDDGWEHLELGDLGKGKVFQDLQRWVKEQKNRGVILAVCSKNDEAIAKEVFEKHPDCILKLDDFTQFVANWDSKVDNLALISNHLNLSTDCFVFLDDNPVEREWVKSAFPAMTVPNLPSEPALWLTYLTQAAYFESDNITEVDLHRTELYRTQQARKMLENNAADLGQYLGSLQMHAEMKPMDGYSLPRVAQLVQRTNQFNLRTIRRSESEIKALLESGEYIGFSIKLEDKFGDEGMVSAVLLQVKTDELFIDTWVMSCRVFGRTLEMAVFEFLLQECKRLGKRWIRAAYIPTPKNGYVSNLLPTLGFTKESEGIFRLEVEKAPSYQHYISF